MIVPPILWRGFFKGIEDLLKFDLTVKGAKKEIENYSKDDAYIWFPMVVLLIFTILPGITIDYVYIGEFKAEAFMYRFLFLIMIFLIFIISVYCTGKIINKSVKFDLIYRLIVYMITRLGYIMSGSLIAGGAIITIIAAIFKLSYEFAWLMISIFILTQIPGILIVSKIFGNAISAVLEKSKLFSKILLSLYIVTFIIASTWGVAVVIDKLI